MSKIWEDVTTLENIKERIEHHLHVPSRWVNRNIQIWVLNKRFNESKKRTRRVRNIQKNKIILELLKASWYFLNQLASLFWKNSKINL